MQAAKEAVAEAARAAGYPAMALFHTATTKESFTKFRYAAMLGGEESYLA